MCSLSMEMIHEYLVEVGCKIEYPILVNAFKKHLYNPDPQLQGQIRTLFKDYVNRLATVSMENNMKFINLRPEFVPSNLQHKVGGQRCESQPMSSQGQNHCQQPPDKPPPSQAKHALNQQQPTLRPQAIQRSHPRPTVLETRQFVENHQSPNSIQHHIHQPTNAKVIAQRSPIAVVNSPIYNQDNSNNNQNQRPHVLQQQQVFFHQQYQKQQLQQQQQQPLSPAQQSPKQIHPPLIKEQYEQQQQQQRTTLSNRHFNNNDPFSDKENKRDVRDGNTLSSALMPPSPTTTTPNNNRPHHYRSLSMQQHLQRHDSLNLSTNSNNNQQQQQSMPPPRPPPRRRQSTASMFKPPVGGVKIIPDDNNKDAQDFTNNSSSSINVKRNLIAGQIREHALRLNINTSMSSLSMSTSSPNDYNQGKYHSQQHLSVPKRNESLRESTNRLSRDPVTFLSGLSAVKLQRNGSHLTTRSRSSHRGEDESDSSSLQPTIDPLRRKWAMEACSCNYNGLLTLLREDPKLASYKDIVNGYTALHWAAKFGNLDIIKLIAGTHSVSSNIKSSAGQTPLHVAYMFNRLNAAKLLLEIYQANPEIRDHSGKKPLQYFMGASKKISMGVNCTNNYNNNCPIPTS